jgi:HD-like signal output (HDOD) protein
LGERSHGLQSWIDRLNEAELPALAAVVQDLHRMAREDTSSVQQLADVLLRDATLTSRVLKVANSVYYNPSLEPIRTISRAIVLIGFENVRLIGLSVSLIDSLLAGAPREQLPQLLARSFHAAVQARNIAGYLMARSQEEVFIAALLHNIGELAFWGCGDEQADELAALLARPGVDEEAAVREVLGTSFRQLTLGLVRSWNLGELVTLAHGTSVKGDPAVKSVNLGMRISEAALEGWDSPAMTELVGRLAGLLGVTREEAMRQVLASADEAVKVATTFGASRLCHLIPHTDLELLRREREQRQTSLLQPDLAVLQSALQELGLLVSRKANINLVLDALFQGLHQGAGLERVMVAVLADQRSRFSVRRAVGEGTGHWQDGFSLAAQAPGEPNLFSYVLKNREAHWMGVPASYSLNDLVTRGMREWLGQGMFFIAPLMAGTREIGVLYADSRVSGRALRHEQFIAFQRFAQMAGRCLEAMAQK